ncbi:hypothetical protein CTEN210_03281 [Chaetoceros tenuissimus]|uniref:Uncharacterized protein n=1 Tax=Chaetoceros tenuissimus TaxID=426638 RepID=A0AAD3CIR4_9STRA|nr:hypothetical protein CTEN210_03281 [Chaetoceros tenuissimus]
MSEKDSIMNKLISDDGIASQSSQSKDEERQHIHQINALDMKSKLQTRYDDLPSPPWPQLDHRIAKAILDGTIIGFDPSQVSFDASNTIVTAYYQFTSKHGVGEYEKWFTRLLRASEPMIIFLEPGSSWYDFVLKQRTHAPTIIAPIQFNELVMSTTFTTEFWDFMFSIDLEASVHKSSNVYKIWNEKLILMYASIHLNPFETPNFVWMDAGYFRNDRDAPELNTPVVKINITESVPEEKLLLLHVRNDPLSSPSRVNIAGNSFVGSGKSFLTIYEKYYETFWDWVSIEKFIGSDQFVMTETCRRYKAYCHPFLPGRFKSWFGLALALSGKRDVSQVSPEFLFLDEPPSNPAIVPSGKYISYCRNEIITSPSIQDFNCE